MLRPGGSLVVGLDNASNPIVALTQRVTVRPPAPPRSRPVPDRHDLWPEGAVQPGRAGRPRNRGHGRDHARGRVVVARQDVVWRKTPARMDRLVSRLHRAGPPRRRPSGRSRGSSSRFTPPAVRVVEGRCSGRPGPLSASLFAGGLVPSPCASSAGPSTAGRMVRTPASPTAPQVEPLVPIEFGFLDEADLDEIVALRPGLAAELPGKPSPAVTAASGPTTGRLVSSSGGRNGVRTDRLPRAGLPPPAGLGVPATTSRPAHACGACASAPRPWGRTSPVSSLPEGIDTVVATVLTENRTAVSNLLRLGYRPAGLVGWVGIGPVRRVFRRLPRARAQP